MRLNGQNSIITGAGSGIGRAIALGFAREGAWVAVVDINADAAARTAADIGSGGGEAIAVAADVSCRADVEGLLAQALAQRSPIHALVCAAGIGPMAPFLEVSEAEWDRVIAINLKGLFVVGQVVGRHMAQAGGGTIVNVTSELATVAEQHCAHYIASKGGARMLTQAMALDLAQYGIRVNALAPGLTRTPLSALDSEAGQAYWREKQLHIPMRRPGEPEEMVGAAVFLVSSEASYVTGSTVVVDGGYLAM